METYFRNFDYSKFTMSQLVNAYRNFLLDAAALQTIKEYPAINAMYVFTCEQITKIVREFDERMNIFEKKGE